MHHIFLKITLRLQLSYVVHTWEQETQGDLLTDIHHRFHLLQIKPYHKINSKYYRRFKLSKSMHTCQAILSKVIGRHSATSQVRAMEEERLKKFKNIK